MTRWTAPASPTPQQRAIIDTLRPGDWLTAKSIGQRIGSTASANSIRVQMGFLRARFGDRLEIESEGGVSKRARGYRLVRCEL